MTQDPPLTPETGTGPTDEQVQALRQRIFAMVQSTRSLGLEGGIDLLLQLLYLRWAAEDQPVGGQDWEQLVANLQTHPRPGDVLEEALAARLPSWTGNVKPVAEDGGRALQNAISGVNSWASLQAAPVPLRPLMHWAFEEVLRARSLELGRVGADAETPQTIAQLMAKCLPDGGETLDPACGIGTGLLYAARFGATAVTGWEIDSTIAGRTQMRFQLADVALTLHVADSLLGLGTRDMFDGIMVQPPWGQKPTEQQWEAIPKLPFGQPSRSRGEFVWLQSAVSLLRAGGRAAALLPLGTLFRGDSEGRIRAAMLTAGVVEAVIALPAGMVASTSIPSCLWVLRLPDFSAPAGQAVLLLDAASFVEEQKRGAELSESGVLALTDALRRWRTGSSDLNIASHAGRVVPHQELVDGSLLPQRYLQPPPVEVAARPRPPRRLLSEVRIANFKSFNEQQRVPVAPITLIYGPNSSGKSSLLQSLLLLKQSVSAQTLVTQGQLTDAGSFVAALHRHEIDRVLEIGISYGAVDSWNIPDGVPDPSLVRSIDFDFRADGSGLPRPSSVRISFGSLTIPLIAGEHATRLGGRTLDLDLTAADAVFQAIAEGTMLYPFDTRRHDSATDSQVATRLQGRLHNGRRALRQLREAGLTNLQLGVEGLLPSAKVDLGETWRHAAEAGQRENGIVSSYVNRTGQLVAGVSSEVRLLLDTMAYLGPLRSAPQRFYNRASAAAGVGTSGEHIALHLFDNSSEVAQVNQWLEQLGVPYTLRIVPVAASGSTGLVGDIVAMILTDQRSGVDVTPADVGFGVSQVLPIVVELLSKQDSVLCIEQPEIHLHPGLQAKLADLLIETTAEEGRANQVLVETHSEHLILRLQRRIREGALSADHVSIVYVDPGPDGAASITKLRLDDQGEFRDEWPRGFFAERLEELFEDES